MKIYEPIAALPEVPPATPWPAHRPNRQLAYKAAQRSGGQWVPIECEGHREALYLANGARRHATLTLEAEQRGSVVYLRCIGKVGRPPAHAPSHAISARASLERAGQ